MLMFTSLVHHMSYSDSLPQADVCRIALNIGPGIQVSRLCVGGRGY
jgi:hypothetical protein